MTLFSEKMLISNICIRGLMPNLIKINLGRSLSSMYIHYKNHQESVICVGGSLVGLLLFRTRGKSSSAIQYQRNGYVGVVKIFTIPLPPALSPRNMTIIQFQSYFYQNRKRKLNCTFYFLFSLKSKETPNSSLSGQNIGITCGLNNKYATNILV